MSQIAQYFILFCISLIGIRVVSAAAEPTSSEALLTLIFVIALVGSIIGMIRVMWDGIAALFER